MNKPTINVDVHGKDAPAGATFGKGATTLAEIKEATSARDNLSKEQSRPDNPKVRRD
jgi:hypothetical protein